MTTPTEAQLRLLCNDPDDGDTLLATADYTAIIGIESGSVYRAAALACRTIAAQFATKTKVAAGSVRAELQQKFEHYMSLAREYDFRASEGGGDESSYTPQVTGISIDEMDDQREDTDRVQSEFEVGMHDNEAAYAYDLEPE